MYFWEQRLFVSTTKDSSQHQENIVSWVEVQELDLATLSATDFHLIPWKVWIMSVPMSDTRIWQQQRESKEQRFIFEFSRQCPLVL